VQKPLKLHIGFARANNKYIWQFLRLHANENAKGLRGPGQVVLKKTVVMVGMMGAGKTAVGTALARLLAVPFLDSDEEIVRAAQRSIAEIFERDGEPFFRARETEVIGRLLRGAPCVLSTGGGAFLSEANRAMISDVGASVWLRADLDLLWQRVRHKTTRPLLRTPNPRQTLADLYAARVPLYQLADVTVDSVPDLSVEAMANEVAAALARRPDVLEPA
jgi:shikimate kinase